MSATHVLVLGAKKGDILVRMPPSKVTYFVARQLLGGFGRLGVFAVFGHFSTSLFALAAFFGALLHVFVVRERFAILCTAATDVSTGLANCGCKGTTAGGNVGRCRAGIRTILAGHERLDMFPLAGMNLVSTMGRAGVTGELAVSTRFRAGLQPLIVLRMIDFLALLFGWGRERGSQRQG